MTANPPPPERSRFRILRGLAGVAAVLFGVGLIVVVSALGHCSAFGGSCPSAPRPLWEDDVFGSAAFGGFIAVGVPVWMAQPTLRRLRTAVPAGLVVALFVGLIARSAAAG